MLVVKGNSIAGKPITCDQAFANYLIYKSIDVREVRSFIQASKMVLNMRDFLNKKGYLFTKTEPNKDSEPSILDFTEA